MSRCSRNLFRCLIYFCSRNTGCDRFGFVFREDDEAALAGRDLGREVGWVRLIEDPGKFDRAFGHHDSGVEDPLIAGARFVIDPCLLAVLVRAPVDGFRRRGEQVQPQSHEQIKLVQELQLDGSVVAIVERVATHHVAVLLLHVTIVRLVGPGPGEEQVPVPGPFDQGMVDELAPIVESMPMIGNGNTRVMCMSASNTHFSALFLTVRFTVHPVAMSVTVRVKQNSPDALPPS